MNKTPLTMEEAQQLGGAMHRLREIGSSKIISPQNEAEQRGLVAFLQRVLVDHVDELLASWLAVHNEYEPLIGSFAALLNRATGIIARSQQAQAEAAAKQQQPKDSETDSEPENVIKLERAPK